MRVHAEKLIKSVVTVLGVLEWDGPSLTERYLLAWIRSMHLLRTSHCEIEALQWLDRCESATAGAAFSILVSAIGSGHVRDSTLTIRPCFSLRISIYTSKVSKSCFFCSRAFCLTLDVTTGILSLITSFSLRIARWFDITSSSLYCPLPLSLSVMSRSLGHFFVFKS